MHILYILDFYKPNTGGIEVLLNEIIQFFGKEHKVSVITWNFNGQLSEIEKKGNITIYRIKAKNLILYTFFAYKFGKKIIKNVDIIHANNFYSAIVGSKLSKKYKKKSVLHIHGFFRQLRTQLLDGNFFIKKLKVLKSQLLEKLNIYGNFDKYICVSKYVMDVARFYYGIGWEKLELVYNGLDYKKWKSYVKDEKVEEIKTKFGLKNNFSSLFYGRVEKVKGWEKMLENLALYNKKVRLLAILHGNIDKFKNKIVELGGSRISRGYQEDKKKIDENKKISRCYENEIFKLNNVEIVIENKVEHNEIGNYIKAVDCVIFPSIVESFGYVALETSILKTPIVTTNMGAIPEITFGKVNFFEFGDKNSFLQALNNIQDGKFEQIPEKDFYIQNTTEAIDKIYKNLLKKDLK